MAVKAVPSMYSKYISAAVSLELENVTWAFFIIPSQILEAEIKGIGFAI